MKSHIRAVTIGIDAEELLPMSNDIKLFYDDINSSFEKNGYSVDTKRIVFCPQKPNRELGVADFLPKLQSYDRFLNDIGVRWYCLPISISVEFSETELFVEIPKMVKRLQKLFIHFIISPNSGIETKALLDVAKTILSISRLSGNGFDNFRLGVGCNIRPNTPFFPFSYHDGDAGFSVAADIITICIDVLERYSTIIDSSELFCSLVNAVSEELKLIDKICRAEANKSRTLVYKGLDCSLAPYPNSRSVAYLLEQIAPHICGDFGTLSATAFLTKMLRTAIKSSGVLSTGFNGVMFSPLEDSDLAKKIGRTISLEKLILYSTVCGCGLDMVPISGTTSPDELASLLQDVMVLSSTLIKPLGVRVLPIPTKTTNEMTEFNHDFLVNCRILPVDGQGLLKGKILSAGGVL